MRIALAIAAVTLALGLVSRPMLGQVQSSNTIGIKTIRMVDAQTGWAVWFETSGLARLSRTTDGGLHWRDVTPLNSSGNKIDVSQITALSSNIAWVTSVGPSDSQITEIFRTTDGGHKWGRSSIQMPTIETPKGSNISFINPREGWFLAHHTIEGYHGVEAVGIFRSTDGGEKWSAWGDPSKNAASLAASRCCPTSITFLNSTTGWIAGIKAFQLNELYLYVTHDGGHSWQQQDMPLPRELPPRWTDWGAQPPKFFTARDGILPAFFDLLDETLTDTRRGLIVFYATHDGGSTWAYTPPVPVDLADLHIVHQAVADMDHAWVMDRGVLRATSDGGRSWTTLPQNSLIADVEQLDFISPNVGWAVRSKVVAGLTRMPPFLLRTLDGGRTWNSVPYTISRR